MNQTDRLDGARMLAPAPRVRVAPLSRAPTFSIVIPAYQAAETIGHAIDTALAQIHPGLMR